MQGVNENRLAASGGESKGGAELAAISSSILLVDHALHYAARSWPVFPVHSHVDGRCTCGEPDCTSIAKHPANRTGFKEATTDPLAIEQVWAQKPWANIGLATGRNLVVLDVDGPEGLNELKKLVDKSGALPRTLTARTGNGWHLYFACTDAAIRSSARGKLHVRGTGGYCLLPPSRHASGRDYQWVDPTLTIATLPDWLKEWMVSGSNNNEKQNSQLQHQELPTYLNILPARDLANTALSAIKSAETTWSEDNQTRILNALDHIDAKGREIWRDIGMILKDLQWLRSDGSDIGFEIWDDWSQTCPEKYPGIEALTYQWNSFGRSARSDKVGLGTLFLYAEHGGYLAQNSPSTPQQPLTENGAVHNLFAARPISTLDLIDIGELLQSPAPPRAWLVDRWIPAEDVTMLAGDGGTGKSTLVLQLALSLIAGKDWLGLSTLPGNVLYVSAEDNKNEVHWRLQEINRHANVPSADLKKFKFADLSQEDAVMALFQRGGFLQRTTMFDRIETAARQNAAKCIILDAAADVFGGQEIDRREVRAFIGSLRALAMRLPAAVLFLAHPSVDAIKTDRGYSGSTHWNNAVRSRLLFKKFKDELGAPVDPDRRVLELAKSNRSRSGDQIHLIWSNGHFTVTSATAAQSEATCTIENETFLALLEQTERQGINVSPYRSPTFAPTIFSRMPKAGGIGRAALERAMNRLLDANKIRMESFGPPSKARHRLVKVV